ncbi:anti-sigma factor [Paraburkholderia sp. RL17-368-BIF-A]|jgi:anti-sigma factor RsiW|uniref:anti-sigma factor family protein n=1 Tax=Paraburkholderia sp. RL17-368-BIF-A TaxID=3031628 RepID=UPI0006B3EDAA|nr:anti-sigma factor [Burkholderia sp. HB1]
MKIDDASLLAYVDGELSGPEREQVEKAIRESEDLASRVSMLRASQLPYRHAFEQQALPPMPESLGRSVDALIRQHVERESAERSAGADAAEVAQAAEAAEADNSRGTEEQPGDNVRPLRPRTKSRQWLSLPQWPTWPKLAVAFVAGAFCCGLALRLVPQLAGGGGALTTASDDSGMTPWIKAAAGYQKLYTRDTVALLQPDMSTTATTVADIQQVDELPVRIPDLRSQGLTFKRVQRLRFHGKPLVQIVYLPEKGDPVALCVLKEPKADAAPSNAKVEGMKVVAWRRGEVGYALIGTPGTVDLDALGRQLYDGRVSATVGDNRTGTDVQQS